MFPGPERENRRSAWIGFASKSTGIDQTAGAVSPRGGRMVGCPPYVRHARRRPAARRRRRRPRPSRSHRQGDPTTAASNRATTLLPISSGPASPRCGPRLRTSIRGSRHRSPSCGPGSRTLKPGRPALRHAEALSDSGRTKMADSRCVVQVPVHRNVIRIRRRGCGVKLDADHQRTRPG